MSATTRRLLTLGCLVPLPALTALLLLAMSTGFDGDPNNALQTLLFWAYWVLLGAAVATWGWTLAVIRRSPLLSEQDRRLWLLITILGTVFVLPLAWWLVVRPTPARDPQTS